MYPKLDVVDTSSGFPRSRKPKARDRSLDALVGRIVTAIFAVWVVGFLALLVALPHLQ